MQRAQPTPSPRTAQLASSPASLSRLATPYRRARAHPTPLAQPFQCVVHMRAACSGQAPPVVGRAAPLPKPKQLIERSRDRGRLTTFAARCSSSRSRPTSQGQSVRRVGSRRSSRSPHLRMESSTRPFASVFARPAKMATSGRLGQEQRSSRTLTRSSTSASISPSPSCSTDPRPAACARRGPLRYVFRGAGAASDDVSPTSGTRYADDGADDSTEVEGSVVADAAGREDEIDPRMRRQARAGSDGPGRGPRMPLKMSFGTSARPMKPRDQSEDRCSDGMFFLTTRLSGSAEGPDPRVCVVE